MSTAIGMLSHHVTHLPNINNYYHPKIYQTSSLSSPYELGPLAIQLVGWIVLQNATECSIALYLY